MERHFPDSGRGREPSVRYALAPVPSPPWHGLLAWRSLAISALLAVLCACGGGGSSSPAPAPQPATPPPDPGPPTSGCSADVASGPFEGTWPSLEWESATPESQGLCPDALKSAIDYAFTAEADTGAVVIVRNGRIVAERYADDRGANDQATSWSVAKSFTSALVGAALDDGLIDSLDQSMADFIPAWQDTDKAAITLRHMMTVRTALEILDGGDFRHPGGLCRGDAMPPGRPRRARAFSGLELRGACDGATAADGAAGAPRGARAARGVTRCSASAR